MLNYFFLEKKKQNKFHLKHIQIINNMKNNYIEIIKLK